MVGGRLIVRGTVVGITAEITVAGGRVCWGEMVSIAKAGVGVGSTGGAVERGVGRSWFVWQAARQRVVSQNSNLESGLFVMRSGSR
jgi:hypothetical protein